MNDIPSKVKNFLNFVDGLPVKDKWVDEVRELISRIKKIEEEKVNYMTFQMKIAEERAEAEARGEAKGIKAAIAMAKDFSIGQSQVIEQLMKRFDLTHDQALAAVQANW